MTWKSAAASPRNSRYLVATVSTFGEAFSARWSVRMRCARGDHRGIVKIDACRYETKPAATLPATECLHIRPYYPGTPQFPEMVPKAWRALECARAKRGCERSPTSP